MFKRTTAVLVACAAIAYTGTLLNAQGPAVKRTVLLQHDTSAPGFEAILVAVEIPVGGREGRHMHPGTAMIHVTDGALTLDYEFSGWLLEKAVGPVFHYIATTLVDAFTRRAQVIYGVR